MQISIIAFFVGELMLLCLPQIPNIYMLLGIFLTLCLCYPYIKTNIKKFIFVIMNFLLGLLFLSFQVNTYLQNKLPKALENIPVNVEAEIIGLPIIINNITQIDIEFTMLGSEKPYKGRARIFWLNAPLLKPSQCWQLPVKFKRPHNYNNPGGFNKKRFYLQLGLQATGNVIKNQAAKQILKNSKKASFSLTTWRYNLRAHLLALLDAKILKGPIIALIMGSTEYITESQWAVFQKTGTAHLMAISGLHISLITLLMFSVGKILWAKCFIKYWQIPSQQVGAMVGLGAAFIYASLAGWSTSTKRAFIMIGITMLCIILKRKIALWHNFIMALGLVLLIEPFAIFNNGFWLSFGSVGLLLYAMQGRLNNTSLWWRFGRAQWVMMLGLIPLNVLFFGNIILVAPLINSIAIPWVSFLVVPLALLGAIGILLHLPIFDFLIKGAEFFLHCLWPLLEYFAISTPVYECAISDKLWHYIAAFIGSLLLLMPTGLLSRSIGIIWLLPIFIYKPTPVKLNSARLTVLDVGQGLSALIQTAHHTLIYDAGPKVPVLVPFLKAQGIKTIDTLLLSHGDNDHTGGVAALLTNYPMPFILAGEPERLTQGLATACKQGQKWEWDGVQFEILYPFESSRLFMKRNNVSCILKVAVGSKSILLTGDIEAIAEKSLSELGNKNLSASILIAPHHGSKSSSTDLFVKQVSAQYVVFAVGYLNRWGFPHEQVVARYRAQKAVDFNTAVEGALFFDIAPDKINIMTTRDKIGFIPWLSKE